MKKMGSLSRIHEVIKFSAASYKYLQERSLKSRESLSIIVDEIVLSWIADEKGRIRRKTESMEEHNDIEESHGGNPYEEECNTTFSDRSSYSEE